MNYGIAPGGGLSYQVPIHTFTGNQGLAYNHPTTYSLPQQGSWGQSHFIQNNPQFTNLQAPTWGFQRPIHPPYHNVESYGWNTRPQLTPPVGHHPLYSQNLNGFLPYGSGCGNCGHSVPTIRRDW